MITDARAFTKKFVKQHALIYNVADGSNPQDYSYMPSMLSNEAAITLIVSVLSLLFMMIPMVI